MQHDGFFFRVPIQNVKIEYTVRKYHSKRFHLKYVEKLPTLYGIFYNSHTCGRYEGRIFNATIQLRARIQFEKRIVENLILKYLHRSRAGSIITEKDRAQNGDRKCR